VTAYEVGGSKLPAGYATTNEKGEYTIVGLAPDSYKVEFSPTPESGLNFVTQYYNGKPSLPTANEVEVTKGATTEKINVKLRDRSGRDRAHPGPSHTTGHAGPHPAVRVASRKRR